MRLIMKRESPMSYGRQIQEHLQQQHQEMLAMLENLVNRNTSSEYKPGVDEAGYYLEEKFEKREERRRYQPVR